MIYYRLIGAHGCFHKSSKNLYHLINLASRDIYSYYYIIDNNGNVVWRKGFADSFSMPV